MGYTKIVKYGNVTEIYEYEKNRRTPRKRIRQNWQRKRASAYRKERIAKGVYERTKRSIRLSRSNFFRLCHHNVCLADTVDFVTITFAYDLSYKEATRHVARFMERIKKTLAPSISYISVPEQTKKGRYHFHLLVFNLPTEVSQRERKTRNLQRQFQRGYIDVMRATYVTKGLAGYLAKYMGKGISGAKNATKRGYTCSRNCAKTYSVAGDSVLGYYHMIIPTGSVQESSYDVPYMGRCKHIKITS